MAAEGSYIVDKDIIGEMVKDDSLHKKIRLSVGDRVDYPMDMATDEFLATLDDLKEKLTEQDMVLSMFQSVNSIGSDVYQLIKADYREAYKAASEVKKKVSAEVMRIYEPLDGVLSWNFSSTDGSLVVYVTKM